MCIKLSQIRKVKAEFGSDWREIVDKIANGDDDFDVAEYRFIHKDSIDEILAGELANDEYILGCFNAGAIADATGWPVALIEAAQKGEQYEAIGAAMTEEHIRKLAEIYVSADGYGHHFASYDGNEIETECGYYAFRVG